MNWQCPRCETFNRTAEKHCEVCELAKPKRKRATETATKKAGLSLAKTPDKTHGELPTKPSGDFSPAFKIVDRRSSAVIKTAETEPIAAKADASVTPLEPPGAQPSKTPGGAVTDAVLWLLLIGFNIYFLYDFIAVQKLGIGSLALGMIFGNLILLAILGAVLEFFKWLLNARNST